MKLITYTFYWNPQSNIEILLFIDPMGEKYNTWRTPWIPTFLVVVSDNVLPLKVSMGCLCGFVCFMTCLVHSVFWDLYCAAPERRETCDHSSEAKAFHDYVSSAYTSTVACISLSSVEQGSMLAVKAKKWCKWAYNSGYAMCPNFLLELSEQSARNLCLSTLESWQSLPHFTHTAAIVGVGVIPLSLEVLL